MSTQTLDGASAAPPPTSPSLPAKPPGGGSVHEAAFKPPSLGLTTMGLCLATFMQVLDTTIANVSLPTIAGNLGVSSGQSTWVITSFAVSTAIALPLTGYLTRRFGEVRLFIWATLLFSLASFLCGIATNMPELILFRALQGAVAGPMYPITQSLLISIYPPIKRGMALALLAMITVVAPIAGPILGGWITDNYSWEWIFFINVPIGLLASFIVAQQMRARRDVIETPKLDRMGLFLLVIGVGSLQVMLDMGNDADWFDSSVIVALTAVAAVALTVFVIWELTHDDPIVNLTLFRKRNFLVGTSAMVLAYAAFFSMGLLVPMWLQRNLGYTSIWAGLATAPIGLLPILLTPVVGKYSSRVDLRWMASFAFLVMALVSFMRSQFNVQVDFYHVALTQFIMGLGVAFFFMPMIQIMLSDLAPREIPGGSGLSTFLRTLGGSFSASITTFLWDERAVHHHAHLTEAISAYSPQAVDALPLLGATTTAQLAQANQMITQQAVQIGFNELFYALAWIFAGLIVVLWFARPPFGAKAGPAAGH